MPPTHPSTPARNSRGVLVSAGFVAAALVFAGGVARLVRRGSERVHSESVAWFTASSGLGATSVHLSPEGLTWPVLTALIAACGTFLMGVAAVIREVRPVPRPSTRTKD
jgi:hypothetical protein